MNSVIETIYSGPDVVFTLRINEKSKKRFYCRQLPLAYQNDKSRLNQFRREFEFLDSLDIHGLLKGDWNDSIDGVPAVTYEFLELHTLGRIVNNAVMAAKNLPMSLAVGWALCIVDALESFISAAYQHGSHELDISIWPDTIVVDKFGQPFITHFSLNAPPSISSSIIKRDLSRYFVYAAPEQIISGYTPDNRVLYFALGMLLFELLTSKPLFNTQGQINSDLIARRKLRRLHPLLSDVNPKVENLNAVVNGLLTPHPVSRPHDLTFVRTALLEMQKLLNTNECNPDVISFQDFNTALSACLDVSATGDSAAETTNINQFNSS